MQLPAMLDLEKVATTVGNQVLRALALETERDTANLQVQALREGITELQNTLFVAQARVAELENDNRVLAATVREKRRAARARR
jgi:hypothetical protein